MRHLLPCSCLCIIASAISAAEPEPQRVGPPTYYIQDAMRTMQRTPDEFHLQFYPVPTAPVTKATYMAWLEDSGLLDYVNEPKRGLVGPAELLPVLAKFAQTGERRFGEACVLMLKDYHQAIKAEAARVGWNKEYIEQPAVLPLYRRILSEKGLLSEPQDTWFREMMLDYTRTLHEWGSADSFWRGPCHRAQQGGVARGLAAAWYPDIPEAKEWKNYSDLVFADFWKHKDLTENDTGYSMGPTFANMLAGPEVRGSDEFITHPDMMKLWERHLAEVTPDGAIAPYGPSGGWNSTAGYRLWMFELIAARTGDGRFRFGAQKLMNYLLYQKEPLRRHRGSFVRETTQHIALAWLVADDSIKPVQPSAASQLLQRKQVLRIRGKADAESFLPDLDPAPDRAKPCCSLLVLGDDVPSKLVFRSGWQPGDFYALVDLFIGADPLNPGGIIGLTRWAAPLTQAISAKGGAEQNRLVIEDLDGTAKRRLKKLPVGVIGETWSRNGESPASRVGVPVFADTALATFATVETSDWEALPVKVGREFAFIKNRFLVVRDVATFEEGFRTRLGSIWNTQNIGPQVGVHFANTFFSQVRGGGSPDNPLNAVPCDLLVWYAPQLDCRLQVIDRTLLDPRTAPVPAQLRYFWEGEAKAGDRRHFTQLYWPHEPYRARVASNAQGAKTEWIGGPHADTAGAGGIETLLDTPETTVLRCSFEKGRVEWIVCNPGGREIKLEGLATDARFAYLDQRQDRPLAASLHQATHLRLSGQNVLPAGERRDVSR